jgi:hypothetical protein
MSNSYPDHGYAVIEEYPDKHHSTLRRVFVGDNAEENAERFASEHQGQYTVEQISLDEEYRRKNA